MKKAILSLAAALLLNLASAQPDTKLAKDKPQLTTEERAQKETERIHKTVNLSEDQKAKVYKLSFDKMKQIASIREKYKGDEIKNDAFKTEVKIARESFRKGLETVLNKEQLALLEAKHKEKMELRRKNHTKLSPEERSAKLVQKLDEELSFTLEQKEKVNAIALTKTTKMQALKEKYKGKPERTDDEKKERKAVQKEFHEALLKILNPEQKEKFKAKQKERKNEREQKAAKPIPAVNDTPQGK